MSSSPDKSESLDPSSISASLHTNTFDFRTTPERTTDLEQSLPPGHTERDQGDGTSEQNTDCGDWTVSGAFPHQFIQFMEERSYLPVLQR